MELNYFDVVVSAIILFLGIKGLFNGFFKEIFGLIGIIGGIFIASRFGDLAGKYLSEYIFNFTNSSAISFTGFLATLIVFWLLMIIAGIVFKKLTSMSGLSPLDRIFGFIFGASKFFLIAAVIAHSLSNVNALSKMIDSNTKDSLVFPVLVNVGSYIMKLDTENFDGKIDTRINDTVSNATSKITQNIKEELINSMPETAKEALEHN